MSNPVILGSSAEWQRFAVSRHPDELGPLSPEEQARAKLIMDMAVWGHDVKYDAKGNPVPNSRPTDGDPNHIAALRKAQLAEKNALKDLLESVRQTPTGA